MSCIVHCEDRVCSFIIVLVQFIWFKLIWVTLFNFIFIILIFLLQYINILLFISIKWFVITFLAATKNYLNWQKYTVNSHWYYRAKNICSVLENSECEERNDSCIHLPVNSGTHDMAIKWNVTDPWLFTPRSPTSAGH